MQLSMYVRLSFDMRFPELVSGTLETEHRLCPGFLPYHRKNRKSREGYRFFLYRLIPCWIGKKKASPVKG